MPYYDIHQNLDQNYNLLQCFRMIFVSKNGCIQFRLLPDKNITVCLWCWIGTSTFPKFSLWTFLNHLSELLRNKYGVLDSKFRTFEKHIIKILPFCVVDCMFTAQRSSSLYFAVLLGNFPLMACFGWKCSIRTMHWSPFLIRKRFNGGIFPKSWDEGYVMCCIEKKIRDQYNPSLHCWMNKKWKY